MMLVLAGLLGRLAQLQIIRGEQYRRQYEQSVRRVQLLPAARGRITDRLGRILAVDQPCKDLCLDYPFLVGDPAWIAKQVSAIARHEGLPRDKADELYRQRAENTWRLAEELANRTDANLAVSVAKICQGVDRIRRNAQRQHGGESVVILEERQAHPAVTGLDDASAVLAELEVHSGRTVGAVVTPGSKRIYPYGDVACHVIGLTAPVTVQDQEKHNADLPETDWLARKRSSYEGDDVIGISGMEKGCESHLRGRRGYRIMETGQDEPVEIEGAPAEAGEDVHLTLDVKLQEHVAALLRATGKNGAAVVISVDRGEVLAMVSVPTYDLRRYRQEANSLFSDTIDLPLLNRAASMRYPPGSTAKPIMALAALSTGKITPETTFMCNGHLLADDTTHWRCTGAHEAVDLQRAIMHSCNIYFYDVGERLETPVICEWLRLFGIDRRTGTGLPEEKAGNVPSLEWLERNENRRHAVSDARQMGIGQGPILATPLEMANVMATIARNGRLMQPLLWLEQDTPREIRDLPLNARHVEAVRHGMWAVVNESGGTAYRPFHEPGAPLGVEVCGKTGTAQASAQRADLDRDGIVRPSEIVREGSMAWFAGFAPSRNPKIAVAVVVEYVNYDIEGGGGANSGPIAREIVRWCRDAHYLD